MTIHNLGFSQEQLRRGALLGTLAHAIWVSENPLMAAMQSWDGPNYLLNDMSGTLGTITFAENDIIGAFFDSKSSRNPLASGASYSTDRYLKGMPDDLMLLARNDTMEYMLQEYQGENVPVITAALWSKGDELVAIEPWKNVSDNGGHILRIQLMDDAAALVTWCDEYGLSGEQADLLHALYERKTSRSEARVQLTDAEKRLLAGAGSEESRVILASIGISV